MSITTYRDLIVWQKSMDLARSIYSLTDTFPKHEMYGLASQMRRAAISIPSNIAEGYRRSTRKDYRSFLINAFGSEAELETQLELASDVIVVSPEKATECQDLLQEVMQMLNKMTVTLRV